MESNDNRIKGYVYFIAGKPIGKKTEVKIGSSKNPRKRLSQLQTGYPYLLTLLHTIVCYERKACHVEKRIQSWFWCDYLKGEWYQLSNQEIEWLKTIKEEKDIY